MLFCWNSWFSSFFILSWPLILLQRLSHKNQPTKDSDSFINQQCSFNSQHEVRNVMRLWSHVVLFRPIASQKWPIIEFLLEGWLSLVFICTKQRWFKPTAISDCTKPPLCYLFLYPRRANLSTVQIYLQQSTDH